MPIKKRVSKRRGLTRGQRAELCHGCVFFDGQVGFGAGDAAEADRQAAWREYRDELLAEQARPGHRPAGWWWYESPEKRDEGVHETIQLARIGHLRPDERAALEADAWPMYERQAAGSSYWRGCDPENARETYWEKRRDYGVPDDFPVMVPEGDYYPVGARESFNPGAPTPWPEPDPDDDDFFD